MAPHSSTLAWKIPWTAEPGRLQSMGSLRVGHDRATSLSLFTFMHWRRKWQPTPVFLPGESQEWGSLVGCPLWGLTESDTTEGTQQQQQQQHMIFVFLFLPSFTPYDCPQAVSHKWHSLFLFCCLYVPHLLLLLLFFLTTAGSDLIFISMVKN